jgi:hypothetical protein
MDWIEMTFWADTDEIVPDSPHFRDFNWDDGDVIPEIRFRERAPSPEDFYDNRENYNEPMFAPMRHE